MKMCFDIFVRPGWPDAVRQVRAAVDERLCQADADKEEIGGFGHG